jgi:hypothetical protein
MLEAKLLLLIGIANGAPVLVRKLLGDRWGYPLDGNRNFFDGRPVFGPAKTIRGLAFSLMLTALCAPLMGMSWIHGLIIGAAAMTGDLLSSFTKRRAGKPSSSMALGLDQIPESLLPMLATHFLLGVSWSGVLLVVVLFFVLELLLSKILYKIHIRKVPY